MSAFSCSLPIKSDDANESLFELLIGECVAEWIDWTVSIAHPVGNVVEDRVDARRTEAHDEGEKMPWCPAQHESSQDQRDGSERFESSVFTSARLFDQLYVCVGVAGGGGLGGGAADGFSKF